MFQRAFLVFLLLFILPLSRARAATSALGWDGGRNGTFVVSSARDARGDLWVGTEDNGVSRWQNGVWTHFGIEDGLGDNSVYALTGDRLGRVWAGHLNHGVSVWNGRAWKNYGALDGPLGERTFAIATSPLDGDVWIAHNAGLSRFSLPNNRWTHFTRASGFSAVDISALAFDSKGNLLVGTACEGLLIGSPADDFAAWKHIEGAPSWPSAAGGEGLPSNLINDVLIDGDDVVWVATTAGLSRSDDGGKTFAYLRGSDWKAKLAGLQNPPTPEDDSNFEGYPLRQDWVHKLALDGAGNLWIGYRNGSYELRRRVDWMGQWLASRDETPLPIVTAIVPLESGLSALGTYGGGLVESEKFPRSGAFSRDEEADGAAQLPAIAPFPGAAGVPTPAEFQAARTQLERAIAGSKADTSAIVLEDDWSTQGDWLGRYGREWAELCAMISPGDLIWGGGGNRVGYDWHLGPQFNERDGERYWVDSLATADRRSLELPPSYAHSRLLFGYNTDPEKRRRESEINDNGNAYPPAQDGPNLRGAFDIPPGRWVLSFYDHNKDGHQGPNGQRDYLVSLRLHDPQKPLSDTGDFDAQPELARARIRQFWDGCYKRFAVRGPLQLSVEIRRNGSPNTMVSGVFLDPAEDEPFPYFGLSTGVNAPQKPAVARPMPDEEIDRLWNALETAQRENPLAWLANSRPFYALVARFYQSKTGLSLEEKRRLGLAFYGLNDLESWEKLQRERGLIPARDLEKSILWDGVSNTNGRGDEAIIALSSARAGLEWHDKHAAQIRSGVAAPKTPGGEPADLTTQWDELAGEFTKWQNQPASRAKFETWPEARAALAQRALELWQTSPAVGREKLLPLLTGAYTQLPYDLPGLETHLDKTMSDAALKSQILAPVLAAMKLTVQGVDPATLKRPQ